MAIEQTLREYISTQINGIYTVSMVVVQSVDTATRTCEVALKYNKGVILDSVPIASPFVGDDAGVIFPVEQTDEGFVIHNRQPIDIGVQNSGFQEQPSERRFTVEDAVLFPLFWNGDKTIPDHSQGELLLSHPSGTIFRMKPDGTAETVHKNGNVIRMNADGSVTLGDPGSAAALLNENATITDSMGGSCSIDDPGTSNLDGA